MLTIDLAISILIRLVAFIWAIKLILNFKDRRLIVLALMLGLMAMSQIFPVLKDGIQLQLLFLTSEFPGLLVSVLSLLVVSFINNALNSKISDSKYEKYEVKLLEKLDKHNYLLPIFSLFFILFLVGLNFWSVRSIETLTDEHHGDHHDVMFQLVNMNLAIGNAIQESYAYVAWGDENEKKEFQEWDKDFDREIEILYQKYKKLDHEEIFAGLINELRVSKDNLIAKSYVLFNEYEQNGIVANKTFSKYEDAIDETIPILEKLNTVQADHLIEEYDVTTTLLEQGKNIISLSTFLLFIITLSFIALALFLENSLKKNSDRIVKNRIAQQKKEQLLLDSIPAMIWQKDDKNNILNLNKVAADSINRTVEDIKGLNAREVFPDEADAKLRDDLEVVRTQKPKLDVVEQYQVGNKKRWIRTDKYPLNIDNNSGVLIVATDVTAEQEMQKQYEQQHSLLLETQKELINSERRGLLGQLSSSIAHELNQPLSSASQFCSSIKLRMNKLNMFDDKLTSYLDSVIYQVNRAGEIIRRVKALSKNKPVEKNDCEIGELLFEATQLIQNELKLNSVTLKLMKNVKAIHCHIDKIGVQQVILNILQNSLNSLKGVTGKREISIAVETKDNSLFISIKDSGEGIKGLDNRDIFLPYTTSSESGLGLGLSLSRKILMENNGSIELDTKFSPGARFVITLPVVQSENLVEAPA